jgi:enamine deaminase RidA (YjgF/YER057c/UK114 family)
VSAIADRLAELGLTLPEPPAAPPGVRLPFEFVRVHGDLAYVSGHGPLEGDRVLVTGRFNATPAVVNGFSDLILELWDDAGLHARSAIGAGELPFGMPVEVEAVVALA